MKRSLALALCAAYLCSCAVFAAADVGTAKIGGGANTVTISMHSGVSADVILAQGSISKDQAASEIVRSASGGGTLIAAVNGGFFSAYYERQSEDGYGNVPRCQVDLIKDGRVINGGGSDHVAVYLGFTRDGRALIDEVGITLYVEHSGKRYPTWGVNHYYPDEPNSLLLFTPEAGADLPVPANAKVAKIVGGRVTEILDSGKCVCAPDTYYFVCGKNLYDRLPAVGAAVSFSTEFSKSAWSDVVTAVSCGPWLLHEGANVFSQNAKYSYLADQKMSETAVLQRTFAAILASGDLMLGTCSASPKQITDYLVSIGAKDAMLLDGGASSMLYANGKTLTSAGRKLNNVIAIYDGAQRAPDTPAASGVSVTVDGKAVQWTDAVPFIDANNRTMVPLSAVGNTLGLSIGWDGAKREASFSDGAKTLYFPIDSTAARASDGRTIVMDTAAVIVSDRTYAPVRYLAEFFGRTVRWDAATSTVIIQ